MHAGMEAWRKPKTTKDEEAASKALSRNKLMTATT